MLATTAQEIRKAPSVVLAEVITAAVLARSSWRNHAMQKADSYKVAVIALINSIRNRDFGSSCVAVENGEVQHDRIFSR